jgi:hypothetical protein
MRKRRFFLFLARAGMELCWISAWANLLTPLILQRPFPLPDAAASFMFAVILTHLSSGRGWRIIAVLGIQSLGFALSGLRILYLFESSVHSFFDWRWIGDSFATSRAPQDWLVLSYLVFWALVLWTGGFCLARRSSAYLSVCSRFDLGLGAFFLLFLTKMILSFKGGVNVTDFLSEYFTLSFFLFGLLGIAWARDRAAEKKEFLPGYEGIGMVLIFTVVVIVFGAGVVLFFMPYLNTAAETGYSALRIVARPVGSIFVAVMRFLYFRNSNRAEESPARGDKGLGELTLPAGEGEGAGIWEKVIGMGLFSLMGLAVVAVTGYAAYCLFRWLFSRTSGDRERAGRRPFFLDWIREFLYLFRRVWKRILTAGREREGSVRFLRKLFGWGRRSGLPHRVQQTPLEYGSLLKERFPGLKREIEQIVESFNREVYGGPAWCKDDMAIAAAAWRKLRHPRHWPVRIRKRLPRRDQGNRE